MSDKQRESKVDHILGKSVMLPSLMTFRPRLCQALEATMVEIVGQENAVVLPLICQCELELFCCVLSCVLLLSNLNLSLMHRGIIQAPSRI